MSVDKADFRFRSVDTINAPNALAKLGMTNQYIAYKKPVSVSKRNECLNRLVSA